jgi:hypothetical protein
MPVNGNFGGTAENSPSSNIWMEGFIYLQAYIAKGAAVQQTDSITKGKDEADADT